MNDATLPVVVTVVAIATIASLIMWLRGNGQPVVLRDPTGRPMDPSALEPGDAADLPATARDNHYIRTPRPLWWPLWRPNGFNMDPRFQATRARERMTDRQPTDKRD